MPDIEGGSKIPQALNNPVCSIGLIQALEMLECLQKAAVSYLLSSADFWRLGLLSGAQYVSFILIPLGSTCFSINDQDAKAGRNFTKPRTKNKYHLCFIYILCHDILFLNPTLAT